MPLHIPHKRVQIDTGPESLTKQAHKDECDIHRILRQFHKTGVMSHIARQRAHYEDLPDPLDFQEALHVQMKAESAFASLPSSVREHFGNDPARFLYAFQDQNQSDYLRSVGLLKPEPSRPNAEPDKAPDTKDKGDSKPS